MADIPASFRLSVPDDFGVDIADSAGDVVITVRGELDVLTAPFLWEQIEPVLAGVTGQLVFDFAELGFIDSMGLGVVVRATSRLKGETPARHVVVRHLNAHARKVFEITGLDRVLDVQP
ncbi:MAG TPA: STAS domain-containing protein [Acidimicrobiia bacterium]|nr:STAS domain-containing protein [Acidimicrobiia bacterium]